MFICRHCHGRGPSPVAFGAQFLHVRVGEPVSGGDEGEVLGELLARDRLDLTAHNLERVPQGMELLSGSGGECVEGSEIGRLLIGTSARMEYLPFGGTTPWAAFSWFTGDDLDHSHGE